VVVGIGLVLVSLASFVLVRSANLRLGCLVFLLAFFFPLWAGLQIGLAAVLHEAFPLVRGRFDLVTVLWTTLVSYWSLILMNLLAEFSSLWSYWRLARRLTKAGSYPVLMYGPLINAGRMFLIVWMFGCLHWAGAGGYSLYAALILYFFPWDAVPWKALFCRGQGRQPTRDPDQWVIRYGGGFFRVVGLPLLIGGLSAASLPLWNPALRHGGGWPCLFVVVPGMTLAAAGLFLAFGGSRNVIDRREHTYSESFRLGFLKKNTRHSLRKIESILIKRTVAVGGELTGETARLKLTGRNGTVEYEYAVRIKAGGEEFQVASFDDHQGARQFKEELCAFLGVPNIENPSETDSMETTGE
jgi:hypothetical protein